MQTEFPYQREESGIFGTVCRPVVGYDIKTRYGWVPVMAYLDSGADITLLPKSFIDLLDIEFREEDIKEIGGVGGSKVPIVLADVKLMVCGKDIEVTAAICLVKNIPYLLGREGIFDHFNICFKKNRIIYFEEC